MPKLKTHKGTAKRFQVTGSGIKRKQANKRHNFTNKNQKSKRQLRGTVAPSGADMPRIGRLLKIC
ncbi:MAG: 50S ribosomal protein L35 [Gammaproteobacteria bacterium]